MEEEEELAVDKSGGRGRRSGANGDEVAVEERLFWKEAEKEQRVAVEEQQEGVGGQERLLTAWHAGRAQQISHQAGEGWVLAADEWWLNITAVSGSEGEE